MIGAYIHIMSQNKTLHFVLKNALIIGTGSAALIWWENRKTAAPGKVSKLAKEAVELQKDQMNLNNQYVARKKWQESLAIAQANEFPPKINFNLQFALACNLDEAGEKDKAEEQFKRALESFPPGFDLHSLEENTRMRVSVCLDRLAQREHDRGNFSEALLLYDRALDALATPEEVQTLAPSLLSRLSHLETLAAILNNVSTLYLEIGEEDASNKVKALSDALLDKLKLTVIKD